MKRDIKRIAQHKSKGGWTSTDIDNDVNSVNYSLMHDLIAHYIERAKYITRIRSYCNYDGTYTYIVYYDNNNRSVYTVKR